MVVARTYSQQIDAFLTITIPQENFLPIRGHSSSSPPASTCSNNASHSISLCQQRFQEDAADILSENLHTQFYEVNCLIQAAHLWAGIWCNIIFEIFIEK